MRGLAFPSNAVYNREASYDHDRGTPQSNNADAIPIDPALSGAAIDPAITGEESGINEVPVELPEYYRPAREPQYPQGSRQYSQGPQGDPFAPQPPAPYLPIEEEPAPSSKPVKKKRRPRREEECGFCQGNDSKNKDGDPEPMVSCEECGRSGHPSCMELGEVSDVVRSYPWKCIECKTCEICQEKGDDNRILFCDFCDRGWHMDCLQPPLEDSPPGRWHCPICPQPVLGPDGMEYYPSPGQETQLPDDDEPEDSVDPSSSRPHPTSMSKRKGKQKAVPTDDSDSDVDMEEDDEDEGSIVIPKSMRRRKSYKKSKGKGQQDSDDEVSSPAPKRPRIRVTSPVAPRPRMIVRLRLPAKGKGKGREDDGPQKGLFDDILGVDDRDTAKTTVEFADKQRFERSRQVAEEKQAPPPPPLPALEVVHALHASSLYRPLRSSTLHHINMPAATSTPGMSASPAPSTPGPSSAPHSLRIRTIRFGEFDIQTWYDAPFPEEYATIPDGRLWICEFCLKYMKSRFGAVRHRMKCKARHPPGDEIYRDGAISVFEVDGRKNKIYCQNLCLLSKMFLDHKSLFYDVEPFLFYVMTEVDDAGARFVGYFSKEKRSPKDYNVSCIMTLPVRQRQGWGNLLIDFSYLLSKKEQRAGSPEKPLSGLGALGYKNYWSLALMRYLDSAPDKPSLEDISAATSMTIEDIHTTLTQQNMISSREVTPPPVRPSPGQSIKFPKGRKHGIARRHLQRTHTNDDVDTAPKVPFSPPRQYEIRWDREYVTQYLVTWEAKGYLKLKPEKLKWSPFLLARMKKTEGLQTLTTESSAKVDPITLDSTPVTTNGPATPQNGARHPSVSIFDDNAVVSGSHESLNTQFQPREQGQESGIDLPVFDSRSDENRTPSDEIPDTPHTKRPRARPKSSSSGTNYLNGNSAVHEPHCTRSDSARASELEQSLADDEALAAKLALEERRSSRSLRARPEKTPDLRRTVSSTSATRSSSPRKRRRVESSPESESGSLTNPGTPVNGTALQHSNGSTSSPRHLRKALNGSGADHDTSQPPAPLTSRKIVLPPSPLSPTSQTVPTTKANDIVDVKSEAATTPLTALTSRHSVDTVIVSEGINGKKSEGLGNVGPVSEALKENDPGDGMVLTDEDADADVDEDLDAEGEIDAEGELDVEVTF